MVELRWGERTWVMGIINVTPDSFSGDGIAPAGRSEAEVVAAALEQARDFVAAGAQILDVGGESSRPAQFYGDHPTISAEDEAALAVPVVAALARAFSGSILVSIDTSKGSVARQALAAGATIVNDVWAGRRDPDTLHAAVEAGAHLVLMHNKEVAEYPDGVFPEVVAWLAAAVEGALAAGNARDRLIVDPGIGFGKTAEHNLLLLRELGALAVLGRPILLGTSRKSTLGRVLDLPADERLEATLATTALGIAAGVDLVRVHDVRANVRAARMSDAIVRGTWSGTASEGGST